MKISSSTLVVLSLILLPVTAAFPDKAAPPLAAEKGGVVEIKVFRDGSLRSDGRVGLIVGIKVEKGWHINSNRPLDEFMIPTTVELADNPFWTAEEISYPEGEKTRLSFSTQPVSVYQGNVEVPIILQAGSDAPPQTTLKLLIGFQPCNDTSCTAPETLILPVPISAVD